MYSQARVFAKQDGSERFECHADGVKFTEEFVVSKKTQPIWFLSEDFDIENPSYFTNFIYFIASIVIIDGSLRIYFCRTSLERPK